MRNTLSSDEEIMNLIEQLNQSDPIESTVLDDAAVKILANTDSMNRLLEIAKEKNHVMLVDYLLKLQAQQEKPDDIAAFRAMILRLQQQEENQGGNSKLAADLKLESEDRTSMYPGCMAIYGLAVATSMLLSCVTYPVGFAVNAVLAVPLHHIYNPIFLDENDIEGEDRGDGPVRTFLVKLLFAITVTVAILSFASVISFPPAALAVAAAVAATFFVYSAYRSSYFKGIALSGDEEGQKLKNWKYPDNKYPIVIMGRTFSIPYYVPFGKIMGDKIAAMAHVPVALASKYILKLSGLEDAVKARNVDVVERMLDKNMVLRAAAGNNNNLLELAGEYTSKELVHKHFGYSGAQEATQRNYNDLKSAVETGSYTDVEKLLRKPGLRVCAAANFEDLKALVKESADHLKVVAQLNRLVPNEQRQGSGSELHQAVRDYIKHR